jgi:DNA-directed RNA polymerase specialized sigma24 family protein
MAKVPSMATDPALNALNHEWQILVSRSARHLAEWARTEASLSGADDLDGVLELIRRNPDEVLAALLRLGLAGHPLAHRVVLQTMLGMLVRSCAGRPALLPEAISELWLAIAEYPVERRPRAIATNLAWSVRRKLNDVPPPRAPITTPDGRDELDAAAVLAQARLLGLIDGLAHRTLWTVYVEGLTSRQAAARLGTTAGAVRWRCSQALRRLATRAELLAA